MWKDGGGSEGGDECDGSHNEEDKDKDKDNSMAVLLWSLAMEVVMALAVIVFDVQYIWPQLTIDDPQIEGAYFSAPAQPIDFIFFLSHT